MPSQASQLWGKAFPPGSSAGCPRPQGPTSRPDSIRRYEGCRAHGQPRKTRLGAPVGPQVPLLRAPLYSKHDNCLLRSSPSLPPAHLLESWLQDGAIRRRGTDLLSFVSVGWCPAHAKAGTVPGKGKQKRPLLFPLSTHVSYQTQLPGVHSVPSPQKSGEMVRGQTAN